jgi:DedD protein
MDERLKQRLVGATVLVALAVIFIPMVLDREGLPPEEITATNIPPGPEEDYIAKLRPSGTVYEIPVPPPVAPPSTPVSGAVEQPSSVGGPTPRPRGVAPASPEKTVQPEVQREQETPQKSSPKQSVDVRKTKPPKPPPVSARPAPKPAPVSSAHQPSPPKPAYTQTAWVVQVGSFASAKNAQGLQDKLLSHGFVSFIEPNDEGKLRVFVGPELAREQAVATLAKLEKNLQLQGIIVSYP